jgi:exopolysaccharide biosynthesis polyprenyl glycosylphosphotransferase
VSLGVSLALDAAAIAGGLLVAIALGTAYAGTRRARRSAPARIAVLGSWSATVALAGELRAVRDTEYELAGRIAGRPLGKPDAYWLGELGDLRSLLERHKVDVLLLAKDTPRMAVFDELARSCQDLPVRLWEVSAFYERRFRRIPIAEISSAWFQCVLHPRYSVRPRRAKRAFDVTVALLLGLACSPLLLILGLLIRRDGGPVLYRQIRIGERGRPFTILKLRTMAVVGEGEAAWCLPGDERVTRLGALLRRTHIDELPQLVNILRGEMSLVGPRPEQPGYVTRLERTLPFYSRRHQLRPGLTGWAQIHCGYAGSERGSMWKLSHDLYYLKHRSLALDVKILLKTLQVFGLPQFAEPADLPFIFGFHAGRVEADAPSSLSGSISASAAEAPERATQ